jgi:hypothetical protein
VIQMRLAGTDTQVLTMTSGFSGYKHLLVDRQFFDVDKVRLDIACLAVRGALKRVLGCPCRLPRLWSLRCASRRTLSIDAARSPGYIRWVLDTTIRVGAPDRMSVLANRSMSA